MNEAFLLQLQEEGRPLSLTPASQEGIRGVIVNQEFDSWPRPLAIESQAANERTRIRLKNLRSRNGWPPNTFKLNRFFRSGQIGFRGVDDKSLPIGSYSVRVHLRGYPASETVNFRISGNEETTVRVILPADSRSIKLTKQVADFDRAILKVIQNEKSKVDGASLGDWLSDESRRPARRACALNLLAKLRANPKPTNPLIRQIDYVSFVDIDRLYASVKPELLNKLERTDFDSDRASGTHRRLLKWAKRSAGIDPADYELKSFRQSGRSSMQCVVAVPRASAGPYFADIDIDEANPWDDIVGFFLHVGELIDGEPTDHLSLRKKLGRGEAAEFLYYTVA